MKSYKIKSYCKVNLSLRVINKLDSGYHNIMSLITFCDLHDIILVSKIKNSKDKIVFSGKFQKGINRNKNTVTKLLNLLRKNKLLKNQAFKINIKKNIPHGSGLGGGSSNAADLLNYFNTKMQLRLNKKKLKKIARKIGFDVPISLEKKNTILTGKKDKILRINRKFGLSLLIVYPNINCSTEKIYRNNTKRSFFNNKYSSLIKNKKKLINFLRSESNDLEKTAIKIYPRIKRIIEFIEAQKDCHFSRITGSGSACIVIFSKMKNAIYAKKKIKLRYPKYWCAVSKTI